MLLESRVIGDGNSEREKMEGVSPWKWFLILLLPLLIAQCSIERPAAPTWDLTLSVPLINKHYDMASLIDRIDEPYLELDSLGNPSFCFEEDLDTIRLVGKLRCDSTSTSFKDTLGVVDIRCSESRYLIWYLADFYQGNPGVVPPCTLTVEEDMDPFTSFSEVTATETFIGLTVGNHLGLDLSAVEVSVIDRGFSTILHTDGLTGGVADGDSVSREIVLVDKTFSNQLAVQVKGISPGGEVLSFDDKYLLLRFSVDSMRVVQGVATVPSFQLLQNDRIQLATGSLIDSAHIQTGRLSLNVCNFFNLRATVYIDFPGLERDGNHLSVLCNLPASSSSDLFFVLDDYTLKPDNGNEATIETRIWSPGSEGALVDFASSDSVTAQAFLSEIIFNQVCGIIEPTRVEIEPVDRQLDIPPGFESAHLTNASLSLEIHNGVALPADLSVDILGESGQNLSLQADVEAGGPFGTAVTSIFEDQLESLLSPVPQSITVTGEIICGDGESYGVVREQDFFFGAIKVSSPLELILDPCEVQIDADSDEVDDEVKEMIRDQINFGKIVLKVESHLPLGGEAELYFSRSQEDLFSNPDLTIGPVAVPAGELGYDGSAAGSSYSETEINLTYQDLQVFTSTPFYTAGSVYFAGTGGEAVAASASDFIKIISYLELNVKNKKE